MIRSTHKALRGDTIYIPLFASFTNGATVLIQLRNTPDTPEYMLLEIEGDYIVVTSAQSRVLEEQTYLVEVEEQIEGEIRTLQRTELIIVADVARDYGTIVNGWTSDDLAEIIRRVKTPATISRYLPEGDDYITDLLPENIPTEIYIPSIIKDIKFFEFTAENKVKFLGDKKTQFKFFMSSGLQVSTSNVLVNLYLYKNGVRIPGFGVPRLIASAGDTGALAAQATFELEPGDLVNFYIVVSKQSRVIFSRFTSIVTEIQDVAI